MYLLANKFDLASLFTVGIRGIHRPSEEIRKQFIKRIKELDEDSLCYLFELSEIAQKLQVASVGGKKDGSLKKRKKKNQSKVHETE